MKKEEEIMSRWNSTDIPLVSVFCTTYNHEKYIRKCVEGFLMQETDFCFEIIIHDDASPDNTQNIIKKYAKEYPQIIKPILQIENQTSKNPDIIRKIMVEKSKGKYIAFCEGDDYWIDKHKLQSQIDYLEKHNDYSACVHNTKIFNCRRNVFSGTVNKKKIPCNIELKEVIVKGGNGFQTSSLVCRREYQEGEMPSFFNYAKGYSDYPLAIYLALEGKIRYLPECMSVYQWSSNTTAWSSGENVSKRIEGYYSVRLMLEETKRYIDYKNWNIVNKAILRQEYEELNMKGKYGRALLPPYTRFHFENTIKRQIRNILYLLIGKEKVDKWYK